MYTIKAIETVYNGYKFRSRLEARWATFFDTLGIPYEYEKEGYDLEGTWYLPDFWLPEQECWVEIKGQEPTHEEILKARLLALYTGHDTHIFAGNIGMPKSANPHNIYLYHAPHFTISKTVEKGEAIIRSRDVSPNILMLLQQLYSAGFWLSVIEGEGFCGHFKELHIESTLFCEGLDYLDAFIAHLEAQPIVLQGVAPLLKKHENELLEAFTVEEGWHARFHRAIELDELEIMECPGCHDISIGACGFYHSECDEGDKNTYENDSPRIVEAYTAARQARFERGGK